MQVSKATLWKKNKKPENPTNSGHCVICEDTSEFVEMDEWLRDHYICSTCGSIPRHRALVKALNRFYPNWREMSLHESSPGNALSDYLKKSCKKYSSSHYYEDIPRGKYSEGHRSEDISRLTYAKSSFDIFITSDVFEHVIEPELAFKEIARVLRPGGAHIFTMPWYPQFTKSVQRAKVSRGKIKHLKEPVYHGNPIDDTGSLVTYDWGRDFCDIIYKSSGMSTIIYLEKDRGFGLDAEHLEVFISTKNK